MATSIGALSTTLFLAAISLFLAPHGGDALKLPFRPTDILPLLPQQLSRPIINYLRHGRIAEDNLPVFVGAASASDTANIQWKAPCFDHNSAWLELHNKSGTPFGGGALHIKVSKAHTWYCDDTYLFATAYRVKWDYFFLSREHIIEFDQWISKAELEYVKTTGVSIFITDFDLLGALHMLREVFPLITSEGWSERSNINFLQKHMEASFMIRPKRRWISTNISTDDIHSGDLLAISRFRGRQGGIQTLEKWVTGSYAGHIAVCLKDEGGKLWVGESGRENDEGEAVIAILPWEEWWEFELKNDYSIPNIALLPLSPDIRAKFNEIWNQVQPANAANVWNEGFNKRLGTEGLGFAEILDELHRRGSCFAQILPIPEKDDWVYSDGKSTSCAAFVLGMYKEAGLFGPLSSLIQIKDAYSLRFFEEDKNRLPKWCNDPYKLLPFCQILGKYLMELPGYNSMEPYAHMNERCPSMPPKYRRPVGC
nr:inositol-1,4,5-trisphosphate 5-phosphatase [Ipomoea batatas]